MSERAVIVGVGQARRRPGVDFPDQDWRPVEAVDLVADCLRSAASDAGDESLLQDADAIGWIPAISWRYDDPPARLAQALGRGPIATGWATPSGGDSGVQILNDAANRIATGSAKIVLLGGCEVLYSRRRARKQGIDLEEHWTPGGSEFRLDQDSARFATALEIRHGVDRPIAAYPLLENALRASSGRNPDEHLRYLAALYARFSEVAEDNPVSWFPDARSEADLARVDARNRWVGFPYPKNMNAIMEVDQGAGAIVMAESEADRRGIPQSKRVTFLGGARSVDAWSVSLRPDLTTSPAYAAATREAQQHAGIETADIDLFDLYSCFPSAVQLAMKALGIEADDPRGFTQTGGLAHHGGPGNAYSMHAVCNTVNALRQGRGKLGWVSGLGMTATKHAVCALSTDRERIAACDGRATQVDLDPALREGPELVDAPNGDARIESYTVLYDRENLPKRSIFLLQLADGRRSMANGSHDSDEVRRLTESEGVGLTGQVTAGNDGEPNLFQLNA